MLINSRPPDRRRMIHELSDLLNTPAEYLRPPTYGYRIGSLVVNRDGTITTDSPQVIATIRPFLLERGYLPDEASATSAAPPPSPTHRSRMGICAPLGSISVRQLKILIQILYCRQHIQISIWQSNRQYFVVSEPASRVFHPAMQHVPTG